MGRALEVVGFAKHSDVSRSHVVNLEMGRCLISCPRRRRIMFRVVC